MYKVTRYFILLSDESVEKNSDLFMMLKEIENNFNKKSYIQSHI